jgi:hypothetical protein
MQRVSVTKLNWLMLFKEMISIYTLKYYYYYYYYYYYTVIVTKG